MVNAPFLDVLKVTVFVVVSFLLAACLSPYFYDVGKGFAVVALSRDTSDEVNWLAEKAGKADFAGYFRRSVVFIALALAPFLVFALNLRRLVDKSDGNPWSVWISPHRSPSKLGQALGRNPHPFRDFLMGIFLTGACVAALIWVLFSLNWFQWKQPPEKAVIQRFAEQAIVPAMLTAVVFEVVFRGIVLGIFLRSSRPVVAVVMLSAFCTVIYFLIPPATLIVSEPHSTQAGFAVISEMAARFWQSDTLIYQVAAVFLINLILGYARYATASLWLPLGLHLGGAFAISLASNLTMRRVDFPSSFELYVGEDLLRGLVPLSAVLVAGLLLVTFIKSARKNDAEMFAP